MYRFRNIWKSKKYRKMRRLSREKKIEELNNNMFSNEYLNFFEYFKILEKHKIRSEELLHPLIDELHKINDTSNIGKINETPVTEIDTILKDIVLNHSNDKIRIMYLLFYLNYMLDEEDFYDRFMDDCLDDGKLYKIFDLLILIYEMWSLIDMVNRDPPYITERLDIELDEKVNMHVIEELIPLFIRIMRFENYRPELELIVIMLKGYIAQILGLRNIRLKEILPKYIKLYNEEINIKRPYYPFNDFKNYAMGSEEDCFYFFYRAYLLIIITEMGQEEAIPTLLSAFKKDPSYSNHQYAMEQLVKMKNKQVISEIKEYIYFYSREDDFYEKILRKIKGSRRTSIDFYVDAIIYGIDDIIKNEYYLKLAKEQPLEVFKKVIDVFVSEQEETEDYLEAIAEDLSAIGLQKNDDGLISVLDNLTDERNEIAKKTISFLQ